MCIEVSHCYRQDQDTHLYLLEHSTDGLTPYSCDTLMIGLALQSALADWWCLHWIPEPADPSVYTITALPCLKDSVTTLPHLEGPVITLLHLPDPVTACPCPMRPLITLPHLMTLCITPPLLMDPTAHPLLAMAYLIMPIPMVITSPL